jgi:hypothetical protein
MYTKFDNLDDLNLTNNLLIIQETVKKWLDIKPENDELKQLRESIINITLIVNKLQLDRGNYHIALDDYRTRSLRSIERARRAEKKLEKVEEEVAKYKQQIQLGL